jgi:hypothetical protein
MSLASSKSTSLQAYTMLVYRKPLHPEFFGIEGRRRIDQDDFEFEGWIFPGGQVARFQSGNVTVCEVVTDQVENLPEKGLAANLPCAGERDYENTFGDLVTYMTTMQTETLSEHLYESTYREMLDHARISNSLVFMPERGHSRPELSLLGMQRYRTEVHVQGYHLRADCGLVLRTQSLFKLGVEEEPEDE